MDKGLETGDESSVVLAKRSSIVRRCKSSSGQIIVTIAFAVFFAVLLLVSLLHSKRVDVQVIGTYTPAIKALYLADAGVEEGINWLRDNPKTDTYFTRTFPSGEASTYSTFVDAITTGKSATLYSTGEVSGIKKTLYVTVNISTRGTRKPVEIDVWKEL